MKFKKIFIAIVAIIILLITFNYARLIISYNKQKSISTESFDVNGKQGSYVPQGITYSTKYNCILQTAYSKKDVSMLYVTDFESGKLLKALKLYKHDNSKNMNHVGGITTNDDKVWITSDFEINEYNLDDIMRTEQDSIKSEKDFKLRNRGDFCLYNDNTLWIGDFYLKFLYELPEKKPLLMGYNLTENIDYEKPDKIMQLPNMVQGMAITSDNKFVFSRSYSGILKSNISVYEKETLIKNTKIPPMAEGIFIKDDFLYVLYESCSDTYQTAYPKIDKILKYDMKNFK